MSSKALVLHGIDEEQLVELAARLAPAIGEGAVIHLVGELGAGKTTFARALLVSLGVGERVKSPTYSLIESYRVGGQDIHHLDLYRIADADELEWLGLPDLCSTGALLLIEWPERGAVALPRPDLVITLEHAGRLRAMHASASSRRGEDLMCEWLGQDHSQRHVLNPQVGPSS